MEKHEFLSKIYEDFESPAGYSGISKLYKHIRSNCDRKDISKNDILEFLKSLDSQTLHGQVSRRFMRKPVKVSGPGQIIGVDYADLGTFIMGFNENYRYVLVLMDCFSRKVELTAFKNKTSNNYISALQKYLHINKGLKYHKVFSDEDQAFLSNNADRFYKKNKLVRYSVKSRKFKNSLVERFIQNLKNYLFRYFTHNKTYKFTDILNSFQLKYNSTPHKGLCYKTPNKIHELTDPNIIKEHESEQMVQKIKNYGTSIITKEKKILNSHNSILKAGTYVRLLLSNAERVFAKTSSEQIYTTEIFKIYFVDKRLPVTYYLEDLNGEKIIGVVYRNEIKPVSLPNTFSIEKILDTKIDGDTGKPLYLVQWLGYSDQFNSWVDNIMEV